MTKRQLRTRWLAVLAVMTLLFAACGGEGEGDTTTTEGAAREHYCGSRRIDDE